MKRVILSFVAVFVLVCGVGGSALGMPVVDPLWNVTLEFRDLESGSGDGLIVYDRDTELEWLNLSKTVNKSYNEVVSEFVNDPYYGFHYASTDELLELYAGVEELTRDFALTSNGKIDHMPDNIPANYADNVDGVLPLLTFMSPTYADLGFLTAKGMFGDLRTDGNLNVAQISLNWIEEEGDEDRAWAAITKDGGQPFSLQSSTVNNLIVASYLVRDPAAVPLPGAVIFLGSGFLALIGAKRRFGRK